MVNSLFQKPLGIPVFPWYVSFELLEVIVTLIASIFWTNNHEPDIIWEVTSYVLSHFTTIYEGDTVIILSSRIKNNRG